MMSTAVFETFPARRNIPYSPDRKYQKELVARSKRLHAQREQLRPALARMLALIYDGAPDNASSHQLAIPITEAPDMHVHPLALLSSQELGKLEMYVSGLQMEVARLEDHLERRLEEYVRKTAAETAAKSDLAERVEGLHRQQDDLEAVLFSLPNEDSFPPPPTNTHHAPPSPSPASDPVSEPASPLVAAVEPVPTTLPASAPVHFDALSSSSSSYSSYSSRSRSNSSATSASVSTNRISAKPPAANSPPPRVDPRLARVGHWPQITAAETNRSKAFPHAVHPKRFSFSPALSVAELGSLLARSSGRRVDRLERETEDQHSGVRPDSVDSCARLWRDHAQALGLAKAAEAHTQGNAGYSPGKTRTLPAGPGVNKYLVAALFSAK